MEKPTIPEEQNDWSPLKQLQHKTLEELDDDAADADECSVQTQLHEQFEHIRGEQAVAKWVANIARCLTLLYVQLMNDRERFQCALYDP